jgi:DNA-binding response OmpR family regulator
MAELIKLTLHHGVYAFQTAASAEATRAVLGDWQPHLVILDMDLDGRDVMEQIGANTAGGARLPVIGPTRRGDLRSKLATL